MSKLFLPRCQKWPRAFPCKYLKLLSNLLKASSSTALPAITKNPSQPQLPPWPLQPQLPPWLLQPQLPPWLPQSWSPAATATCCRAASGTAARCTLSSTRSWSPSGTWAMDLSRGLQDTSQQSYNREDKAKAISAELLV